MSPRLGVLDGERFAGTWPLVRLALRRDRLRIPLWVVGLVGVLYLSAQSVRGLYQTQAEIDAYAALVGESPATKAIAGPDVGLHSLAGIVMYETYMTVIAGISIMAVLMTSRHTRAEEESGHTELLRATETGRHAGAAAAMIVTGGTCLLVGAGMAAVLPATPLSARSAAVYGLSMAVLGLFLSAMTLCFAQVFVHGRAVSGAGLAAFLLFYVVRGIGDVRGDAVVWLSPIGWVQATHVPTEDRLWPLLLPLVLTAGLFVLAIRLADRRDFGGGLREARRGVTRAPRSLAGTVGLAWRMQRGAVLAWALALAACGAMVGALGTSMQDMIRDNPDLAAYVAVGEGGSIIDAYQATFILVMTLAVGGFAVWSAGRIATEEGDDRLDLVLAGPVGRSRSLFGELLVTLAGVAVLLLVSGVSAGLTYAAVADDPGQGVRVALAPLIYLPAIAVLVGVVVLTYGWAPRWSWVGWVILAFEVVLGWLGGLLDPPRWMFDLSIFDRTPRYPLETLAAAPLVALALVGAALLAVGGLGFRRRDVA
jgi:ABC-2 type transport system permease protein